MDELLTKEEILDGLPAGRACTLLFLIENKTAYAKAHALQAWRCSLSAGRLTQSLHLSGVRQKRRYGDDE